MTATSGQQLNARGAAGLVRQTLQIRRGSIAPPGDRSPGRSWPRMLRLTAPDLIELRTRCRRCECSLGHVQERVQEQLDVRKRRISVTRRARRRHRLLDERMVRFAYVRPLYRDLLLIAIVVGVMGLATVLVAST